MSNHIRNILMADFESEGAVKAFLAKVKGAEHDFSFQAYTPMPRTLLIPEPCNDEFIYAVVKDYGLKLDQYPENIKKAVKQCFWPFKEEKDVTYGDLYSAYGHAEKRRVHLPDETEYSKPCDSKENVLGEDYFIRIKHCAVLGLLYHEIGHMLFTDFPTISAWKYQLKDGVWFPERPAGGNTVNGINLEAKMKDIIHSVPEELLQDFNKLFDDLNSKYRYVKFFYSPKGGGVQIHYDFPACTPKEALPEMVKELYLRTRLIVNEAYPEIMKLMSTHWKIEKEVELEFNDTMRDMDFLIALGEYQKNHAPDQPNVIDGEVV